MPDIHASIRLLVVTILLLPNFGVAKDISSPAASPVPRRVVIGDAPQPNDANQWAETEGVVTFAGKQGNMAYLEISSEAGYMPVTLAHGAGYLTDLLSRSRIRVRGIYSLVHNSENGNFTGSLSATNADDITILQLPEETWQRYPLDTINELTKANLRDSIVHLRGKVLAVQDGHGFLLADNTGRITIESREVIPKTAGTEIEALCGWHAHGTNHVFQCGFYRSLTPPDQTPLPTLTTAEQIRWLTPEEARRHYPVKLRGGLTFLMARRGGNIGADLQDGTGGVFLWELWNLEPAVSSGLAVGDFCEVEGTTSAGDFSPMILCNKLTVLGAGLFPKPTQINWDELIGGAYDAEWVEIQGVVLSATNGNLELGMKGGHIACSLRGRGAESYLGDIVRLRGSVYAYHDMDRHITNVVVNIPSQKSISVETPAPADPFSIPLAHTSDLFSYNPDGTAFHRVKVCGQVVHVHDDIYYISDGTNGLRVISKDASNAAVGDVLEAVGFPDIDNPFNEPLLTVRDAIVRKTGERPLPAAIKITTDDLLNREHDATWVQVESRLLTVSQYRAEEVLELQTGGRIYRARLDTAAGRTQPLRVGSRLELTGVYAVGGDNTVPFELLLNSPTGIRVLELPSWWTVQRALLVIGSMALMILLAVFWIGILRQQVSKRTQELSSANLSLKSEIAERKRAENELVQTRLQHLVEQERTRIARDLHDDLGSRVTRIVLLNELALQNRVPPESFGEHAHEISSAARQVIQSLDETVWAVNPRNDTLSQLFNYLSDFAMEFLKIANVRCRFDFPDYPPARTISAEARHNLFLAVKEALNNAVRHAQATEVWLRAVVSEESLTLTVEDNGRGFSIAPDHPSADGLRNMRQRMEAIGGQFNLESAVETGTKVILTFFWSPRD